MKRLILILSPYLIFGLIFGSLFIFLSPGKHHKDKESIEVVKTDSISILQDSLLNLEPVECEEPVESEQSEEQELEGYELNLSQDGRFMLIVGSFQLEKKAKSLYNDLKSKGYNPFYTDGPYDWIRVCAGTGDTSDELAPIMVSLRRDGYEPWILEKESTR